MSDQYSLCVIGFCVCLLDRVVVFHFSIGYPRIYTCVL